jgi:hypothetical protein
MIIQQLVPEIQDVRLESLLLNLLAQESTELRPFSNTIVAFCAEFSRALFREPAVAQLPDLQALAFWMRKAEVVRLQQAFDAMATSDTLLVPRGLVFHIPPANVDTMFVYSWLLALLTGNRNVIRLSTQETPQVALLCGTLSRVLCNAVFQSIRDTTVVIRYAHDAKITAAISARSDVRIIWGGNETVVALRAIPLPPHAKEITFPDRFSYAVFHAEKFRSLRQEERVDVVTRFFNDAYWFDQMACSAPRLIVWVGEAQDSKEACEAFCAELWRVSRMKRYHVDTGLALQKILFAHTAILDHPVTSYTRYGNEVTLLRLDRLDNVREEICGGGMFFNYFTHRLEELASFVARRDQTLTYFGFDAVEMRRFAASLNGRGIDRIVPVGQALSFHRFWDGYDMLQELTRRVSLVSPTAL